MKIRPVGTEYVPCGHAEERTDRQMNMTKLIAAFVIFANVPKNEINSTKYNICSAGHV